MGISGISSHPIDYPAINVTLGLNYNVDYVDSVNQGENALHAFVVNFISSACGGTTYLYLAGYSQGAEVVDAVYQGLSLAHRARIGGVVLFGDPRFYGQQGNPVDQGTYDQRLSGVAPRQFNPPEGTFGTLVPLQRG